MAITDQRAIRFVNEEIRPIAEKIRELKAVIDPCLITWTSQISANVPNNVTEILEDGRSSSGVSILNGQDINSFITLLGNIQTSLNSAGTAETVSKPCVRVLTILE